MHPLLAHPPHSTDLHERLLLAVFHRTARAVSDLCFGLEPCPQPADERAGRQQHNCFEHDSAAQLRAEALDAPSDGHGDRAGDEVECFGRVRVHVLQLTLHTLGFGDVEHRLLTGRCDGARNRVLQPGLVDDGAEGTLGAPRHGDADVASDEFSAHDPFSQVLRRSK